MRRSLLLTLAALGALLSLVSSGLFAALSDSAKTGTNELETSALAASSELKIAEASFTSDPLDPALPFISCGTFSDDLVSPLITITSQPPGADTGSGYYFCLRNVGSREVNLTASAIELLDDDFDCSGDEGEYDTTCGGGQDGELSDFVLVAFFGQGCSDGASDDPPAAGVLLNSMTSADVDFGTLAPGETRCFSTSIHQSDATELQRQKAQTDRLTWRYEFTGVAPPLT